MTVSCMGGWCSMRDGCMYYHHDSEVILERLCEADWLDAFRRVSASMLGEISHQDANFRPRRGARVDQEVAGQKPDEHARGGCAVAVATRQPRQRGGLA